MTKIIYAGSKNEYVYLLSAQRKLGHHSDAIIKFLPHLRKKKVLFPSDAKTRKLVKNRWR